ncbi:xanthine dehydrogenase family protein molybdopterin-binding subunit [Luteimonas panaciterrae]|uniref:xanthine dehydrogenase family protein molybdopterin-binding subunit n=1 Tax=Luteimonas panaciterrae TaxID=363885 RepID=UPI001CF95747|nr:xanthine dehydrogenase family protein molybdopterin-binding subunit [Luteimonas panaciterrae]
MKDDTKTPLDAPGTSRRRFLKATAVAGGGLLIGFHLVPSGRAAMAAETAGGKPLQPNAFVRITPDDQVTVIVGHSELGQGTLTAISMMVAEELDADWSRVRYEQAPADPAYNQPVFHTQITGGSMSTGSEYMQQRQAGAAARALLVAAAAKRWGVDAASLRTEAGKVHDDAGKRSARYGELVDEAAALPAPALDTLKLKDRKDFKIIGKPRQRMDAAIKVDGSAQFGLDVYLPGMLTAMRVRPPVFGGKLRSFDAKQAKAVPGVVDVLQIPTGIAIIAKDYWSAKKGRDALVVDWDPTAGERRSTAQMRADYAKLMDAPGALVARNDGDIAAAQKNAKQTLTAEFPFPFLAHVPMEPYNAVVDLKDDGCEVWIGTQWQSGDQLAIAQVLGLKPEQVKLHTMLVGGGFGRRTNPPIAAEAAEVAKAARAAGIQAPVKLMWTREDDVHGGFYRPFVHARLSATLDEHGRLSSWSDRHAAQAFLPGTPFEAAMKNGIDPSNSEGAEDMPYAVPNMHFSIHQPKSDIPQWWWRSVGHSFNGFIVETFIDELAHAAGKDPYQFRRDHLKDDPKNTRLLGVLDVVTSAAGWDKPLPKGVHRGIAAHASYGSFAGQVIEVSVDADKRLTVHRVVAVIDCGVVINPDLVRAQVESAVIFGLSGALFQEITLKDGVVEQNNYDDYPVLRMYQTPRIDVHLVNSDAPPSGCGEPGTECVAPALANAIFAATGQRLRTLPLKHHLQIA